MLRADPGEELLLKSCRDFGALHLSVVNRLKDFGRGWNFPRCAQR